MKCQLSNVKHRQMKAKFRNRSSLVGVQLSKEPKALLGTAVKAAAHVFAQVPPSCAVHPATEAC